MVRSSAALCRLRSYLTTHMRASVSLDIMESTWELSPVAHRQSTLFAECLHTERMVTGSQEVLSTQAALPSAPQAEAAVLCAGESDSEEQAISSDSEEQKRWRPAATSGRCAVCKRAKKGRCGTETAPAKCEKRAENARKPASSERQHPLQSSLPSKHSLKRRSSWDLDDMQVKPAQSTA